jgi:hypothetical protein
VDHPDKSTPLVQRFYRNIMFDRDIRKEKGKDYPPVVATD